MLYSHEHYFQNPVITQPQSSHLQLSTPSFPKALVTFTLFSAYEFSYSR